MMSGRILTLGREGHASLTERRSEFIAAARPVTNEEEAAAFITEIKKKYADARHNVYAYVLASGTVRRFSEDGEPQGSAAMPILELLLRRGLDGVAVVVTRYFGGILLGTGGLARAYSSAAAAAIDDAGLVELHPCALMSLTCSYTDYERIKAEIIRIWTGIEIGNVDFGSDVTMALSVPDDVCDAFRARVIECTRGVGTLTQTGRGVRRLPVTDLT